MNYIQDLLSELQQEAVVTRRYLACIPFDKQTFRPHEKSETLGRLAIHVAEILGWWKATILQDDLDFIDFEPAHISSNEALLTYFDQLLVEAEAALKIAKLEDLEKDWSMRYGEEILFTLSKKEVLRKFCMNHLIHHRAQLGVYLRLLDIPVPAVYGPSADDELVTLIKPFR